MMVIAIRLFRHFAVLAVVIFLQCSLLHAKRGFLVGEDTPVWLAERPDPSKPVTYTKLQQGKVQQALEHWQLMQTMGGFPVRQKRSVDNTNYREPYISTESTEAEGKRFVPRRSTDGGYVYPSILLVVDYNYFHSMSESNTQEVIKERILYALAFWRSVDAELHQYIPSPKVSLRITGIVITRDRKASPYMHFAATDSLEPMLLHWWQVAKTTPDFSIGSYDIVAHMTDMYHISYTVRGYSTYPQSSEYCIASSDSPCNLMGSIAGVIVYDDFAFLGIHLAVKKMTNIFGDHSGDIQSKHENPAKRKVWTPTSLSAISDGLKGSNGACMSAPKEHHPPGKPIIPVMAGVLLPRAKQCEASGLGNDTLHCWDSSVNRSTCKEMLCSARHWYSMCRYSNPTLDGTFCNEKNTKICVTGRCVNNN